ncbi:hypothetical protein [Lentzea cavernae]|uniref:Amidohydrolase family protein n=1 Tax=Lentzea cavernae TaxID=2020703 RepID=A0ABQ3ML13_9PSEU|nr:hypothetical protein [Lentzea cavernae]GHH47152.1 hypothetical protein GCM10017774_50950 [Lentzea cavernae]
MGVRISGTVLPSREQVSFVVDGDRLRAEPVSTSDSLWLLPGLVDVHSHPGMEKPGDAYSHTMFRDHMLAHRAAGVLTVRSPGSPDPVADRPDDLDLPRLVRGGTWLALPGLFFPLYGRRVTEESLVAAAVEEAAATGWCKVIGDWMPDDPPVPLGAVLQVRQVRDAGESPGGGAAATPSYRAYSGVAAVPSPGPSSAAVARRDLQDSA